MESPTIDDVKKFVITRIDILGLFKWQTVRSCFIKRKQGHILDFIQKSRVTSARFEYFLRGFILF
jgi:hypothetical protein